MEKDPLITIITVSYNAAKVIDKTLSSLKNQTYNEFEYLVIDGASKDDTLKIINRNEIKSSRIISEPDNGLYDAMNKGLKEAKGKYVLFLNAGDSFHTPGTLELYAKAARDGADIIYGDTVIVDNSGKKIADRHLRVPENLTKESFSNGMLICHQAFMVKKDIAPAFDLSYRFSADYDWCVKCIKDSGPDKCVNLGCVTIDYLSEGLTDKNKIKSLKERFSIMVKHYGLPKTLSRHFGFIFRALRRGRL